MARRKSAEKAARWQEMVRRQEESGVSVRQFCMMERLSEPSFYAWRKKLREPREVALRLPVSKHHPEAGEGPLFLPVRLLDSAPSLEIIHPLGYRIQLTGEVNPVSLRHVIETLDARGMR